jgi:ornithine--oxo-acid transaminase
MSHSTISDEELYGAHHYQPLPVVLVRGESVYLFDESGKRYIDMMSAYSAVSHGHCHPKLVKALQEQATQLNVISRAFYSNQLAPFLKKLCALSGFDKALVMNTGVEAVETALKAARKWAYTVKKVPKDQAEIIACAGNFHGRTITAVGMSTIPQYQAGFGPFPPGFKIIPYGDAKALEQAITKHTAAFLVEPIQGEGGIIVPPPAYLKACREICSQHQVLLICDEIQTGLGRTGKLFAYQHEEIIPDAIVLGKALGGGLLPVSAFLAGNEVMNVFTPGDHGSTFGGNPLAVTVARTALDILLAEQLAERAAQLGNYFQQRLKTLDSPLVREVRGRGLLIGLEINQHYSARKICLKLLERGVLSKETHETVIRLAPPLIISKEQLDVVFQTIKQVLDEMR